MDKVEHWMSCAVCRGRGKKSHGLSKKMRLRYQMDCNEFEKTKDKAGLPVRPKAPLQTCTHCAGTGLISTFNRPFADKENYPHIAIIGAGIGGIALALACLQRQIPFTIFERDKSFDDRPQGYGLTLQQASRAMKAFGIPKLEAGIVSTRHLVHTVDGKVIGEWGNRKWVQPDSNSIKEKQTKRTNIHIARQSLRLALLEQLGGFKEVCWGHQLVGFETANGVDLSFEVAGDLKHFKADLVVGADGIRSSLRKLLIGEESAPLLYLGCIVILGICPLSALEGVDSSLLDGATVFQTANGTERIYMMPYSKDAIMWQLSFPMLEAEAKALSAKGADALKEEACSRTQWHVPVPQILAATPAKAISGYPVYDRELLNTSLLKNAGPITLIGDAAHPMSPFKGQGANQALLDALQLARKITQVCSSSVPWRTIDLRESILAEFETEMIDRSSVKVKGSAAAAEFLHSDIVLQEGDETIAAKWSSSL